MYTYCLFLDFVVAFDAMKLYASEMATTVWNTTTTTTSVYVISSHFKSKSGLIVGA